MPKLLAIEWERRQARYVVANVARGGVTITSAGMVTVSPTDPGQTDTQDELTEPFRLALDGKRPPRGRAIVGVSRAAVDLRELTLPPCPDAELAQMVQHQASRQLTSMGEGSLLDFVPLREDSEDSRSVLATAIVPDQVKQINRLCDNAGVVPQRLLVRSLAAGSLFLSRHADDDQVSLIIDVECDEADLTVVSGQEVRVSRCMRLPSDDDPVPLLAEIRRTLVAVANQTGCGEVQQIYICGTDEDHEDLVARLRGVLDVPVHTFDPFEGFTLGGDLSDGPPEHRGQYTALLGMIADEANGASHAVDFLHPRRPPVPPDRRNMFIVAGAAVAVAALYLGWFAWSSFAELNKQIDDLTERANSNAKTIKEVRKTQEAVAAIEQWQQGDVAWLEELRELSAEFPPARDAMLVRLTLSRAPAGGGTIEMQGQVRDPAIIERMETNLRDEFHEVRSRRVQESDRDRTLTWQFETSMSVMPREKEDYVALTRATERPPAGEAASPSAKRAPTVESQASPATSDAAKKPAGSSPEFNLGGKEGSQ